MLPVLMSVSVLFSPMCLYNIKLGGRRLGKPYVYLCIMSIDSFGCFQFRIWGRDFGSDCTGSWSFGSAVAQW